MFECSAVKEKYFAIYLLLAYLQLNKNQVSTLTPLLSSVVIVTEMSLFLLFGPMLLKDFLNPNIIYIYIYIYCKRKKNLTFYT